MALRALLSFLCVFYSVTQAATPQERIEDRLRFDAEKRIFERLKRQRNNRIAPYLELEVLDVEEDPQAPCFPIETIDVEGATLIPPEKLAAILEAHIGACQRISDLKSIATDITNWYMDAGYITSLAYLDEQDIADRQIDVTVLEGKVESFDDPVAARRNGVFWGQTGDYLNLRDLEVSVDRMNRLPSHRSKIDLRSGSEHGLTVVNVTTEQQPPWRLTTSVNNFGSESTGKTQWNPLLSHLGGSQCKGYLRIRRSLLFRAKQIGDRFAH